MKIWRIVILFILVWILCIKSQHSFAQAVPEEAKPAEQTAVPVPVDKEPEVASKENMEDVGQPPEKKEVEKSLTAPAFVLEIKRLEAEEPLYSIELRDVELADLLRVVAHDYNLNMVVDKEVSGKITASFTNITLEEALEQIAEISNLVLLKKGNVIRVGPNLITRIFILKYVEAGSLLASSTTSSSGAQTTTAAPVGSGSASSGYGPSTPTATTTPSSGATMPSAGSAAASIGTSSASSRAGKENTIYDLLSQKGRVLLGKQPNSLIVIDYPANIKTIEEYLSVIDTKMASCTFKLRYLKATEVVGKAATTTGSSGSTSGSGGSSGGPSGGGI